MSRMEFQGPYRDRARAFIAGGDEAELHQASLVADEALRAGLGPEDVVQIHAAVLDGLLAEQGAAHLSGLVGRSSSLLLSFMKVHAEGKDLDRTRRDLERAQSELRERTAQLVQTGKMTALGELCAGLVHEVNQPLNAVNIIVQDMRRDAERHRLEPESLGPSLAEIAGQVRRIADIMAHLRIYTRRRESSAPERVDVTAPIRGVLKILGEQLAVRGIEVVSELEAGHEVIGNAIHLEQVFMNLIINAQDALELPCGSPKRIVLRNYATALGAQRYVACEVQDNGCGIPPHAHDLIFEPFFTTKEVGTGTGLGLSISRQIVAEHGGQIHAAGTEGGGTTFRVLLPASICGDAARAIPRAADGPCHPDGQEPTAASGT